MQYNTLTINLTIVNRNKKTELFSFIGEFLKYVTSKLKVVAD